jgi:hypothetical protein
MEFKGTSGNWKFGSGKTIIVSDGKHSKESNNEHSSVVYYDGALICESVLDEHDALLISKATEMLEMLNIIITQFEKVDRLYSADKRIIEQAKQLIKEATEL